MAEEKKFTSLAVLEQVIELMENHDLTEVRLSEDGVEVRVKRRGDELLSMMQQPQMLSQAQAAALPAQESQESMEIIKAPMLGTFYRSPQPDQPVFVEVGSRVSAGETVCLLEAMKVFTDLKAEFDCEIVAILAEDSQPVEFDQPLFRVRRL